MIKMINFIRAEGRAVGRWPPDLSSKDAFESEHWLTPQLEDDALLYSLHDVVGEELDDELSGVTFAVGQIEIGQIEVAQPTERDYILSRDPRPDNPKYRIAEIQQTIRNALKDLENHRQFLASDMQVHARLNGGLTLGGATLEARNSSLQIDASGIEIAPNGDTSNLDGNTDSSYFASYSGHGNCFLDPMT